MRSLGSGSTRWNSAARCRSGFTALRSTRHSGSPPPPRARWVPRTATSTTPGRSTGSSGRRATARGARDAERERSAGERGTQPDPKVKELVEAWRNGIGVAEKDRIGLGDERGKVADEERLIISPEGKGPGPIRVRELMNSMGGEPAR